jgi:hypothetical protein
MDIQDSPAVIKKVPEAFWDKLHASAVKEALCSHRILASNCCSTNIVYLCGCIACGTTGGPLKARCSKHRMQGGDLKKYKFYNPRSLALCSLSLSFQ